MTKIISTGWEADRLYHNSVTQTFLSPSREIVLTGYIFKAAVIPSTAPFISTNASSQVLWFVEVNGIESDDDWGAPAYKDNTGGSENLHGGGLAMNYIATSIIKASPWTSAVNETIEAHGFRITIPPKSLITMYAGHVGQGPVDFEIQGILFYD